MSIGTAFKDTFAKGFTAGHKVLIRATNGKIGGTALGMPVLVLTTTGRKSGVARKTPLTCFDDTVNDRIVIVASWGGDDRHPDWYLNLVANPEVGVLIHGKALSMVARTGTTEEKADVWPTLVGMYKGYAAYQKRTERDIPVVILTDR